WACRTRDWPRPWRRAPSHRPPPCPPRSSRSGTTSPVPCWRPTTAAARTRIRPTPDRPTPPTEGRRTATAGVGPPPLPGRMGSSPHRAAHRAPLASSARRRASRVRTDTQGDEGMGEFWGADTEQLQDLYRNFERGSDSLEDEFRRLGNSMFSFNRPAWEGPDAEAFYAEWERISNEAHKLYHTIEEMGRQLREEAQEQDDASEPEDSFLDTLRSIAEQLYTGFNILKDTAEQLWKGVKEGRIDWQALKNGVADIEDWL